MHKKRLLALVVVLVFVGYARLDAADRAADMEDKIAAMTNEFRKSSKKPPLQLNPALAQAAQQHAQNMATQETLNHVLDGKNYADRIKAAGYAGRTVGENVATAWGKADNAQEMFKSWKSSKPHRENMLGSKYKFTEFGVGVAVSGTGKYYACQVFGAPGPPGRK